MSGRGTSKAQRRSRQRPQVALLIETSNSYGRDLLHGIRDFWREHRSWSTYVPEHSRGQPPLQWLPTWRGDGIIARIENQAIAAAVARTGLPVVDVSSARLIPGVPWVETDDAAISRMAAEHFLERGFRSFGYYSDERFNWSKWRREYFAAALARAGHKCSTYARTARQVSDWQQDRSGICAWLQTLPKPVAVFACYDNSALQVLDACRTMDTAIPDEVAVLGVNNDELVCDLADPPLSSIAPNGRRAGYQAAVLLDRMMSGVSVDATAHLFAPTGVVTRRSTDVLAVTDPHVIRGVRFIREHACEGIRIDDVLKEVRLTRRSFESRFRKALDRTPHEQILRERLNRIKALLAETDLSMAQIAERTGFSHVEYLTVVFQKHVGLAPSVYRRNARG
jgi:LacI family transcriptional regulator